MRRARSFRVAPRACRFSSLRVVALFRNDAMKVRGFEAPLGWEPQPVGSYARLLAAWETKDGGRMTLVAQKVKPGQAAHVARRGEPAGARSGRASATSS